MSEPLAIKIDDVSKIYRLYASQKEQMMHVLGLDKIGLIKPSAAKEFHALKHVSIDVPKGHRIGIIGRNGAGKTTLLKLICGNFTPTSGNITVNGTVQALMNTGLGFHPEFTGMENIRSSLQYNGLEHAEMNEAIQGIIDFCELGEFMDQPFRTYSLGMQARLMFAAATAVKPDILIVDEVLGAGDAYFITKSKARVENLINNGATMLLVSHSTQQVLELCNEVIWMHQGEIRMQGDAFSVVKAYEEYIYGASGQLANPTPIRAASMPSHHGSSGQHFVPTGPAQLQEPRFQPNTAEVVLPPLPAAESQNFHFMAPGGLSRWESEPGIKLCGFAIVNEQGISNELVTLRPAKFVLTCELEIEGPIACRYGIIIQNERGDTVARIWSNVDHFSATKSSIKRVELLLNPLQLGPGNYTAGVSIIGDSSLEMVDTACRYDLLNRSFEFKVALEESLLPTTTAFYHSGEWSVYHSEISL